MNTTHLTLLLKIVAILELLVKIFVILLKQQGKRTGPSRGRSTLGVDLEDFQVLFPLDLPSTQCLMSPDHAITISPARHPGIAASRRSFPAPCGGTAAHRPR